MGEDLTKNELAEVIRGLRRSVDNLSAVLSGRVVSVETGGLCLFKLPDSRHDGWNLLQVRTNASDECPKCHSLGLRWNDEVHATCRNCGQAFVQQEAVMFGLGGEPKGGRVHA